MAHVHLSRVVIVHRSRLITAFDNCTFYRDRSSDANQRVPITFNPLNFLPQSLFIPSLISSRLSPSIKDFSFEDRIDLEEKTRFYDRVFNQFPPKFKQIIFLSRHEIDNRVNLFYFHPLPFSLSRLDFRFLSQVEKSRRIITLLIRACLLHCDYIFTVFLPLFLFFPP